MKRFSNCNKKAQFLGSKSNRFNEEECTEGFRNFAPMEQHQAAFLGVRRQAGNISFSLIDISPLEYLHSLHTRANFATGLSIHHRPSKCFL